MNLGRTLKSTSREKGFSLIEMIAVLVLIGILASVAVPRLLGVQQTAKQQAVLEALNAGASNVNIRYAKLLTDGILLNMDDLTNELTTCCTQIGDYEAVYSSYSDSDSGKEGITINITDGPPGWNEGSITTSKTIVVK